ncbi:hypothetical protein BDM02DRAFT_278170 [Thelephora ganbajun]|uniref:Uncharacterized protein n=1 Tax=Thelephora ganbajun TaxID=370292 RepID=A0ACB6Z981_THEGA|nr:hypothetical protein BDM02DRAFT_278170 [Thelephora ganbajun]
MSFYANDTMEMMMVLNSFGSRFDPQSIPPYSDWVVNNTFDPFGPEPLADTSYTNPGIPPHFQTRSDFRAEGVNEGSRVDCDHRSSEDMTPYYLAQGRSRFAFAQKHIEYPTDADVSQMIPVAHVHQSTVDRSRNPTVSRVVGPRPLRSQRGFFARREPTLAVPKAVYPPPTWLTHFEDYEDELLAEFCPPSEDSIPSTSSSPAMVGVELSSECVLEYPPLNMASLLGFADSDSCPEEDEDYDPFEFDINSNFGSDYMSFGSESSAPASYEANVFDWPNPYQGYSFASAATLLEFPPQGPPSLPSSGPHVPSFDWFDLAAQSSNSLPWPIFTNPFTGAPIAMSPPPASVSAHNTMNDHAAEVDAERFLAEVEEGLGFGSGSDSRSLRESFEGEAEGWCDWFDLIGYTFPALPQQPQSFHVAAGFEAPPLYTTTVPLPDTEEEDTELDAVVILPRSPAFWCR